MEEGRFLNLEKEYINVEITVPRQILRGKLKKDKGIRFTDYFNRDRKMNRFILLIDVEVIPLETNRTIERKKFLIVNLDYIVSATELEEES